MRHLARSSRCAGGAAASRQARCQGTYSVFPTLGGANEQRSRQRSAAGSAARTCAIHPLHWIARVVVPCREHLLRQATRQRRQAGRAASFKGSEGRPEAPGRRRPRRYGLPQWRLPPARARSMPPQSEAALLQTPAPAESHAPPVSAERPLPLSARPAPEDTPPARPPARRSLGWPPARPPLAARPPRSPATHRLDLRQRRPAPAQPQQLHLLGRQPKLRAAWQHQLAAGQPQLLLLLGLLREPAVIKGGPEAQAAPQRQRQPRMSVGGQPGRPDAVQKLTRCPCSPCTAGGPEGAPQTAAAAWASPPAAAAAPRGLRCPPSCCRPCCLCDRRGERGRVEGR